MISIHMTKKYVGLSVYNLQNLSSDPVSKALDALLTGKENVPVHKKGDR